MNENRSTDEEILAAVQRRISGVEPLIPRTPAWEGAAETSRDAAPGTLRVRGGLGFGGFAPLVLVAALLVMAVGFGLGSRTSPASGGASPSPEGTVIVYRLVPPAGQAVDQADLDQTVAVLRARLTGMGIVDPVVTKLSDPKDEIWVGLRGAVDISAVRASLEPLGQLQVIPLDRMTYGYVDGTSGYVAGTAPVPANGSKLSDLKGPTPEPLFTAAEIDASSVKAAFDPKILDWAVDLTLKPAAATMLSRWSSGSVGSYLLIALDGTVLNVPYVQSPITGGAIEIAGIDEATAKRIASELEYGSLPYPIALDGTPETIGGATPEPGTSATPEGSGYAAPTDPAAPTAPDETAAMSPSAASSGSGR